MTDTTIHDQALETILDTAVEAAGPQLLEVEPGKVYAWRDDDGDIHRFDTADLGTEPRRQQRTVQLFDVASFITYISRAEVACEAGQMRGEPDDFQVYADLDNSRVTAVLDGRFGWGTDRVELCLTTSPEWNDWSAISGRAQRQADLADFLEDHIADIVEPDGTTLLQIVQTLQGKTNVNWQSSEILANGARKAQWAETVEAKAGIRGEMEIPGKLLIAIRPYISADKFQCEAAFRFAIREGNLQLTIKLLNADRILETAMADVVSALGAGIVAPVMYGRA